MVLKISFTAPYSSPDRQLSILLHLRLNLNIWRLGVWAQVCQVTLEMETRCPRLPRGGSEGPRCSLLGWDWVQVCSLPFPASSPPDSSELELRDSEDEVYGEGWWSVSPCAPGELCSFSSLAALLSALITLVTNPGRARVIARMYLRLHCCMHRNFKSWKH